METRKKRRWEALLFMGCALTASAAMLILQHRQVRRYVETVSSRTVTEQSRAGSPAAVEETGKEQTVYLTFDDGPSKLTEQYLDLLAKHHARATFFLIGQQAKELPQVVQREIAEGHEVGIHTYTHEPDEIYQSADTYFDDVRKVQRMLRKKFQYQARLWRFPWGSANCYISAYKEDVVARLHSQNLEYADWNVSAEDSVGHPTTETILQNVKKDAFRVESPVVLMHDSGANRATLDSLETIITLFEENGYTFGTLSERAQCCHFGNGT